MFASAHPSEQLRDVPHIDPVAMDLLESAPASDGALGVFNDNGLGVIQFAAVAKAVPIIVDLFRRFGGGRTSTGDIAQAIWKNLPASAVNARVGPDGYWYDLTDGHRLSHEEAAERQKRVVADAIGAVIGSDGWWYDPDTNVRLSYQDTIDRFNALSQGGGLPVGAPGGPSVPAPAPGTTTWGGGAAPYQPGETTTGTGAPKMAGMSTGMIALVVGAAVLLTMASKRKSA